LYAAYYTLTLYQAADRLFGLGDIFNTYHAYGTRTARCSDCNREITESYEDQRASKLTITQ